MGFYSGLTELLCFPTLCLRRRSWPKYEKIILVGNRITRIGSAYTTITNEDLTAIDWEVLEIEDC